MSTIKTNTIQPTAAGNNLIFANGSAAEKMRITDAGLVGVGTVTPTAKLQTIDTYNAARFGVNNINSLTIGSHGGSPYSGIGYNINFNSGNDNQYFAVGADHTSLIRFNNGGFEFKGNATNGAISGTPFALTEYMTILKSGNVGIGIVSPDSPLHVLGAQNYGSAANSGIVTIGNANNSRQINLGVSDTNSAVYIEGWVPGVGGSHLVLQPSGGRVGIGITAPSVALDVVGEARSSTSTTAGSNAKTLVTKDYVDEFPKVRAWVTFTGTGTGVFGTNLPIRNSYRVATVTHISLGNYLINFSASQSTVNYCVSICHSPTNGGHHAPVITSMTSTSVGIFISKDISASYPGYNPETVCVSILY